MALKSDTLSLKRPTAVILDVSGPIAKRSFMAYSDEAKQFVKDNVAAFVKESNPNKKLLRIVFNFMKVQERQDIAEGKTGPPLAEINASKEEKTESIVNWILHKIDNDPDVPSVCLFQLHMREWGYAKGILTTEVYDEVQPTLERWKNQENIQLYVTLPNERFLEQVLSNTTAGNLLTLLDGNINLMELKEGKVVKSFDHLSAALQIPANKLLFLTRMSEDCRLAKENGICSVLVVRSDFDKEVDKKVADAKREMKEAKAARKIHSRESCLSLRLHTSNLSGCPPAQLSLTDAGNVDSFATGSLITVDDLKELHVIFNLAALKFK